jgi:uncharacterized protein YciI
MEYFVYCRDRPGTGDLRARLNEQHWSFMDQYAGAMIARGPTLTDDGEAATGSVHIVDLPDLAAAREFAFDEPNYRAGVYGSVLLYRFRNLLGRTMWDFADAVEGHRRFLVLALGDFEPMPVLSKNLIVYGQLLTPDVTTDVGGAAMLEATSRDEAAAAMPAGDGVRVEVHPWRFGGRPK